MFGNLLITIGSLLSDNKSFSPVHDGGLIILHDEKVTMNCQMFLYTEIK